jgi:hypothetical protein
MDRTENIVPIVAFLVAIAIIGADIAENADFQSVHWRTGGCLTTAVVSLLSTLLPSNGSIRHSMKQRYCGHENSDNPITV